MIILPLPFGGQTRRRPVVTLALSLACFASFLAMWIGSRHLAGAGLADEIVQEWRTQPHLEPGGRFRARFVSPQVAHEIQRLRSERVRYRYPGAQEFHRRCEEAVRLNEADAFRAWALVPTQRVAQLGWLTYPFVHFSWLHLIGNVYLLLVVGRILEDAWGSAPFLAFYFAGGLVAGVGEVLWNWNSEIAIGGASGAVAACTGAFVWRYRWQKIRFGYLLLPVRPLMGTFEVAALLWGGYWFITQAFSLFFGTDHVAYAAHLSGFLFGVAVAEVVARRPGLVTRAEPSAGLRGRRNRAVAQAERAAAAGDVAGARRTLEAAAKNSDGIEAVFALAAIEARTGDVERATHAVSAAIRRGLAAKQDAAVCALWSQVSDRVALARMRPALLLQLSATLETQPDGWVAALPIYENIDPRVERLGARAMLRAAQLRLERARDVVAARELLARVDAGALSASEHATFEALRSRVHDHP